MHAWGLEPPMNGSMAVSGILKAVDQEQDTDCDDPYSLEEVVACMEAAES